ncbi:MAG: cbb3-type cytochrome c oxidase subunit I [Pseudomonadales bacterium]|nr:cbb3-type cytochrome c oxidase subunit I [Pseudomonadales bacterium]
MTSTVSTDTTRRIPDYTLSVNADRRRDLAVNWLWLSVMALAGAGVFSVLLVLARTPVIGELIPYADFFHTALVIHVDLSVLVWILAFSGVLWSLAARTGYFTLNRTIFYLIASATALIAISGFLPGAKPLMSNYIPVLENPVFLTGLVLFGVGIGAQVLTAMSLTPPVGAQMSAQGAQRFGLNCAAISVLMSIFAFAWSWIALPLELTSDIYYEFLFWGGGHVLQYTYTLLMMVCWLWLASVARIEMVMSERIIILIYLAGLVSVFIAPLIYYSYEVTHPMHLQMFTWLMSFGGSLATFPLGLAIYYGLVRRSPEEYREKAAHSALMTSLMLFACGGVIGFMIDGRNVTIPAHYHGCIVGVTLALMGVAYDILPRLGFPSVNFKWARIQLWVYAGGQFLHILGLVWSGGYGVQRKVAGAAQGLDSIERIAGMGLMGLGGLISAIGGLMFVIIALKALLNRQDQPKADAA